MDRIGPVHQAVQEEPLFARSGPWPQTVWTNERSPSGPPRGTSLKITEPDSAIVVMSTISPTSGIRHHSGSFALTAKAMLIGSRP
jgi:hypothetical protein